MESGRRLRARGLAMAGVLFVLPLPVTSAPPARADVAGPQLRILLKNRLGREALRDAALGAASRMARPGCQQVFSEFADASGQPLQQRLDALDQTPIDWLSGLVFADAGASGFCKPGVLAFTEPGSRAVHICPAFAKRQRRDARLAEIVVIHELLHTLGLEENPPSSIEITSRVTDRCGS